MAIETLYLHGEIDKLDAGGLSQAYYSLQVDLIRTVARFGFPEQKVPLFSVKDKKLNKLTVFFLNGKAEWFKSDSVNSYQDEAKFKALGKDGFPTQIELLQEYAQSRYAEFAAHPTLIKRPAIREKALRGLVRDMNMALYDINT